MNGNVVVDPVAQAAKDLHKSVDKDGDGKITFEEALLAS